MPPFITNITDESNPPTAYLVGGFSVDFMPCRVYNENTVKNFAKILIFFTKKHDRLFGILHLIK